MQAEIRTGETDRIRMDFCRFGHGEETLVILPGLSVQSVMPMAEAIAEAYQVLTDDFTVYVFDRRKGILPAEYTVKEMADDTAEVMDALGLRRVSIFGASQGGMMAMRIAIDRPDLVGKLILGSSASRIREEQRRVFREWTGLAAAGRARELYLSFGRIIYPEDVYEGAEQALAEAAAAVTEEDLMRFISMTAGMVDFDISDELERITCPVLVIGSKSDRLLGGEASEEIAAGLRNSARCELYLYDGYGHAAYDCAPDYRQRMLRFLVPGR